MPITVAVLVSSGCHPILGRPQRPYPDSCAVELALRLDNCQVTVVHCGRADSGTLPLFAGMGVDEIEVLALDPAYDILAPLTTYLAGKSPDIILAGNRAVLGEGSGFLPYALAHRLGLPLISYVAGLSLQENRAVLTQTLPKARQRQIKLPLPFIATTAGIGIVPRQSAYAKARRHRIKEISVAANDLIPHKTHWQSSPARTMPKRLKPFDPAFDVIASETSLEKIVEDASPEEMARQFLHYIEEAGLIKLPVKPAQGTR